MITVQTEIQTYYFEDASISVDRGILIITSKGEVVAMFSSWDRVFAR